ncbi:ROK family transcriptional regulator [Deinococcus hopiensis]|uniref:ROK family transcriptional regulator n=1 Tax=Deinococcus hopiensis TaxID=309885 RepID=UPI00148313A8|nr:ROK family transcriptional regulator [Deinococcus hopiensis]
MLHLIRQHHEISQAEIRTITGHSASSISSAVKRAQNLGLIQEAGVTQEALGRPRTLLTLNPSFSYTIGVQLNAYQNEMVLTDLQGKVIHSRGLHSSELQPQQIADDIATFIADVAEQPVVGVGLAVSGIIDHEQGICLDSTTTGWHNVPIASIVSARTGIPTYVENDANALALAELLFGEGRNLQSFIVLTLGKGIGAGIVIDRALYRGRNGIAGEVGHVRVATSSDYTCHCGKSDCLEAVASARAITRMLSDRIGQPVSTDTLGATLSQYPQQAAEVLTLAGDRLGGALAFLATVFDPDAVFIAPEPHLGLSNMQGAVTHGFHSDLLPVSRNPTTLKFLEEATDMWARGAASIAIERFFETVTSELVSA